MDIRPLTGGLGAEIMDADIRDSTQFEDIHAAFAKYSVIVVRDQQVSPGDHLESLGR